MDMVNFEDFAKCDLRIGTVKQAMIPEWGRSMIQLLVDFGSEIGERTILFKLWEEVPEGSKIL